MDGLLNNENHRREEKRFGDILLCYKNKLFTRYLSDPYIIILKVLG